jgi:hypothetical protein
LIVVVLVVLALFNFGVPSLTTSQFAESLGSYAKTGIAAERGFYPGPIYDSGFAPEVQDRKIIKNAYLSTEVQRGKFLEADKKLKDVVSSSDSYLLNENVQKYETGVKSYYQGSYSIKVDTKKYDSVVAQLKEIGEVKSFSESSDDVTGSYTNLQTELEAERARLQRYKELFAQAQTTQEKLELSDRIFNQERTIKYLEEALTNINQQITYSSVSVTMTEKQSGYASIAFVKFSELIANLVNSTSGVLSLVTVLLPYAIALWIIVIAVRRIKKRK